jgi:hypothetical protein
VINVLFLDLGDQIELFHFDSPTGQVSPFSNPAIHYQSTNTALAQYPNRVAPYALDSARYPGGLNAWCNFKCSGCHRPIQAVHEWVYDNRRYHNMRRPGNTPDEQDNVNRRPYPPAFDQFDLLGDEQCWIGHSCVSTGTDYGLTPDQF